MKRLGVQRLWVLALLAACDSGGGGDPVLGELLQGQWHEAAALAARIGDDALQDLVGAGILVGDHAAHAPLREREARLRETAWWTPAAVARSSPCSLPRPSR